MDNCTVIEILYQWEGGVSCGIDLRSAKEKVRLLRKEVKVARRMFVIMCMMALVASSAWAVNVTFQVDMRYQPDFDPAVDFVGPRGSLAPLDWHQTFILTDPDGDSIYTGMASFDPSLIGSELQYKFVFGADTCWDVTWEEPLSTAGANRTFTIPSADTTLPVVYFSDIDKPPTSIDVTVTFNVNTQYIEAFVPDSMAIRGSHDSLNWWNLGQWPYMEYLGDSLWQAEITFPAGTTPYIWYKYNARDPIFGWQWEPIPGNRLFAIVDTAPTQILPMDYYGFLEVSVEEDVETVPDIYTLSQNYPNPFNSITTIKYQLPKDSKVILEIYNLAGQKVRTLVDENLSAGFYTASWNGKDSRGQAVVGGIYFYRIAVETNSGEADFVSTKKLILLR